MLIKVLAGQSAKEALDLWGFIPLFLKEADPRPAIEQINERYIGGWMKIPGAVVNKDTAEMEYPGDPPQPVLSVLEFRDEFIVLYPSAVVAVVRADGTYEVSRLD
jgi:hypothetical protein